MTEHQTHEYIPICLGKYLRREENRGISQFQLSVERGDNYPQDMGIAISPLNEDGLTLNFYLSDLILRPVDHNGQPLQPISETEHERLPEDTRQRFEESDPDTSLNTSDEFPTTSDNSTDGQIPL